MQRSCAGLSQHSHEVAFDELARAQPEDVNAPKQPPLPLDGRGIEHPDPLSPGLGLRPSEANVVSDQRGARRVSRNVANSRRADEGAASGP
jgi:hypothetical protein